MDETINGIANKVVKLQLRRADITDEAQMRTKLVQIVANERAAFEAGYSQSATRDGLAAVTIVSTNYSKTDTFDESEPMEIDKMAILEEQIYQLLRNKGKI